MMTSTLNNTHGVSHDNSDAIDIFGFWIYIMSDCILFATIFATFSVLHGNTYGGPAIKDLTSLPYVFIETIALLTSSFTYGLAMIGLNANKIKTVSFWLIATFLFGSFFVGLEINEFVNLYLEGHTWESSAALSAFFTLVGTHGFHVILGLVWMFVLLLQLPVFGISSMMKKRLTYLGLFWAFLDIVWIFVFTIVYLMGAI